MALLPEREPPVLMRASPRPRGSAQTPPPGTEEVVLTKLPGGALATFPRKPLRIDRPASAVEYQVSDDLDAQFGTWIEPLPRRIAADTERGFLEKMYEKNRSDNRKSEMTLPHFQAAGEHVSMEYTVTQGTFPYERRVEHVREKYRYVFTVRGYHETDVTRREADQFLSSVKLPEPWVRAPLGEKASVIFPERPDTQSSQQDFTLRASLSKSVTFEASLNFLNRSFTPKQVRPILQERINDEIRRKVFPQIRKPEFRESQGHTSCDYTIQMMDKRWKRMVTHVRGKLAYTVSVIALSEKDLNTPEANQFLNSLEIVN
jgi:hypothetical protein